MRCKYWKDDTNMKFSKLAWTGAAALWTASLGGVAFAQDAPATRAPATPAPEAPAPQQRGGGQGRGGYNAAPTLANMPVAYMTMALGLKDEQKTKIQAIQDKVRTDMQDLRKPDENGQRPDRATLQPKITALNDQAKKDIEALLTPEQLKKSATLVKTAGIYNSAGIPLGVVADLKLTADQDAKLAAIAADADKANVTMQKDMADAQGDQQKTDDLRQARQTARKATQDKALAVMTDAQKTMLTQYQKDHPGGRGGNGGGNRQPAPAPAGGVI
jgi:hypothetical protein